MASSLDVFVSDRLWVREYPVRLGGARFNARMTLIKLASGELIIHSPCAFDGALTAEVATLGRVAAIIAPGTLHWLHVRSCQQAFPEALTYVCPGLQRRAAVLSFDAVLADQAASLWAGELSQVAVSGARLVHEVAFFHRPSHTLILVDLVEHFTAATAGTNLLLRVAFRVLGMWNRPCPAPEYSVGWGEKARLRASLERILAWDFQRVILSHGDLITRDAKRTVAQAWRRILR